MSMDQAETNRSAEPNWALAPENLSVNLAVLRKFEEAQLDGMPDLIVELIDLYLEDAPRRLVAMRGAVNEQDEQKLKQTAHCLKGSSGTLGAQGVVLICDEIERSDFHNALPKANLLLTSLGLEFERVRHSFLAERLKRS